MMTPTTTIRIGKPGCARRLEGLCNGEAPVVFDTLLVVSSVVFLVCDVALGRFVMGAVDFEGVALTTLLVTSSDSPRNKISKGTGIPAQNTQTAYFHDFS